MWGRVYICFVLAFYVVICVLYSLTITSMGKRESWVGGWRVGWLVDWVAGWLVGGFGVGMGGW